jgi:hypothetical protein
MPVPAAPSLPVTMLLTGADYFRRSPSRLGGRGGHKEWQHFLVHTGDVHLLVNFNLVDDPWARDPRGAETGRLIVLASAGGWDGDLETFAEDEVEVTPGRIDARFGRNELRFEDGRYFLSIALRDRPIAAELELVPGGAPMLSRNLPMGGDGGISWLFVPRLEASGTVRVGGRTERVQAAPAYHDHNWGHFRWGDDFAWEWGSALPVDPAGEWSLVHARMSDRGRAATRYQALFLFRHGEPFRVFRDEEMRVSHEGLFEAGRPLQVPRIMALLSPGSACDVPRRLGIAAGGGGDTLRVRFEAETLSQVIMPSECDLEEVSTINEVSGRVEVEGYVRGRAVTMEGAGVFEFVRD